MVIWRILFSNMKLIYEQVHYTIFCATFLQSFLIHTVWFMCQLYSLCHIEKNVIVLFDELKYVWKKAESLFLFSFEHCWRKLFRPCIMLSLVMVRKFCLWHGFPLKVFSGYPFPRWYRTIHLICFQEAVKGGNSMKIWIDLYVHCWSD